MLFKSVIVEDHGDLVATPLASQVPMSTGSKPSVSEEEREAVRAGMAVIDAFRAEHPTMTTQLAYTFLLVVHDEGLSVTEYANKAGMAQSVMSRHIADLGDFNRHGAEGLGLLSKKTDLHDARRSIVQLTPKGKMVTAKVYRALASYKAKGNLA